MTDIKFRLDYRIAEEAELMAYLAQLPVDRHAEQLRRLALQGFRSEHAAAAPGDHEPLTRTELTADAPRTQPDATQQMHGNRTARRAPSSLDDEPILRSLKHVIG